MRIEIRQRNKKRAELRKAKLAKERARELRRAEKYGKTTASKEVKNVEAKPKASTAKKEAAPKKETVKKAAPKKVESK